MVRVKITIDIILSQIPFDIMSLIFIIPLPKTRAFGAVATGSINAHDAARVAETRRMYG